MKRLFPLLLGGFIALGAFGCEAGVEKTSTEAPNSANQTGEVANTETAQQNQADATDETRKRQLESDIRAREQRNNATGGDAQRADADLESEVRSKLEANLPASQLAVEAEDGAVKVSGTVPTQEQLDRIEPLAREIKGVQQVSVNAQIAPAQQKPES
ncbi:BON domain-containing protein [Chroococcidiopsis sp. FACHB-1243]|uniref:BON domain-containing protein n=1 Tax=Chroococcidiopsis sp. [FACHB-1243] TaxID=2692781 RepID=UPI00177C1160|nr:BON domain-containing protein [Chroococcidiopsis sp. [FACHB-1243]]MBD2308625.1 BON domain-containing protein [Chroococcidiopsis sp. [FACHB-1243]]